jgi:tetratricopeptide (TPR) repeat protein
MTATSSAPTVNYYEMLDLPPTAPVEVIEQKLKEEQRTWRKRVGSPDLGKRQEAETRMQRLDEAKRILLDPAARAAYDRDLPLLRTPEPVAGTAAGGTADWVALAQEYLARNDYHSAAYAAREATHVLGNSAAAWNLRSRANAGLGQRQDALYEARQAVTIEPNNAQYHFDFGALHESMSQWADALTSYETAARLDPSAFVYRLAVAGVYLQNSLSERALPILEQLHAENPGVEMVDYYLALCLRDVAEKTPRVQIDSHYVITSVAEIERMEALAQRAASLRHGDADLAAALAKMLGYAAQVRETKFRLPPFLANGGLGVKAFALLTPLVLFLGGLGALSDSIGAGLSGIVLGGLWIYLLKRFCWVPMWKANARIHGVR